MSLLLAYDEMLALPHERKSHGGLGVLTVANGCSRQAWHQIHSGLKNTFDRESLRKMRSGTIYEDDVYAAAFQKYGRRLRKREVVIFRADGSVTIMDAAPFDENPSAFADKTCLVGHPDFIIDGAEVPLWECKASDKSFNRWAKRKTNFGLPADADALREDSRQYVLQGAAYAKAYGFEKFGVHLQDSASRQVGEYVFTTADEWPMFQTRWDMMKEQALNPDREADVNLPPWALTNGKTSYLCRGCGVTSCKNNANYKFEKAS